MTGNYYEEKRNFVRMQIDTQVTYTLNGNADVTYHGKSMDLSATGLLMITDHQLTVGDKIEIVMNPSGERLPPFIAQGSVIRSEPSQGRARAFNVSIKLVSTS